MIKPSTNYKTCSRVYILRGRQRICWLRRSSENESRLARMGHINLRKKCIGKPSEGKLHAGFEEAGDGNGLKYGNTDITAPSFDPT